MNKLLLIFILYYSVNFSQTVLQNQFEIAKDLYNNENYYDAVTELKRLSFFDKEKEFDYETNLLIGLCYKEGAKFSDALFYFTKAILSAKNEKDELIAKIETLKIYILRRQINQAEKIFVELENKNDLISVDEINYWKGWAAIFNNDWNSAANYFSEIDSAKEIYNLALEVENNKYSVSFAKGISYIIPGAGQFYTGNYFSGLLSLGWNFLWGFTAINSFKEERIFDGFAVTLFLWTRFYNGNIFNAGKFAEEENIKIVNKALFFLQNEYKGLKP